MAETWAHAAPEELPEDAPAARSGEASAVFPDADPEVAGHVIAIRDRFGVHGLRAAAALIAIEISIAEDALRELGRP